jgi:hypothetical protein
MKFFQSKLLIVQLNQKILDTDSTENKLNYCYVNILNLNERFFYSLVNFVKLYQTFRRSLYWFFIELNSVISKKSIKEFNQSVRSLNKTLPCDGISINKRKISLKTSPILVLNVTDLNQKDEIIRSW